MRYCMWCNVKYAWHIEGLQKVEMKYVYLSNFVSFVYCVVVVLCVVTRWRLWAGASSVPAESHACRRRRRRRSRAVPGDRRRIVLLHEQLRRHDVRLCSRLWSAAPHCDRPRNRRAGEVAIFSWCVFSTLEMTYVMFLFHSTQVKSSEPQHLFLADSESPCVRDLCNLHV